jgi:hypothetical protein
MFEVNRGHLVNVVARTQLSDGFGNQRSPMASGISECGQASMVRWPRFGSSSGRHASRTIRGDPALAALSDRRRGRCDHAATGWFGTSPPTSCRRKGDWQARRTNPKNLPFSPPAAAGGRRREGVVGGGCGLAFQSSLHRREVGGGGTVRGLRVSDPGKKVAEAYGVVDDQRPFPQRWTFYIGPDGKLLFIDKQVVATSHGEDMAKRLKALKIDSK